MKSDPLPPRDATLDALLMQGVADAAFPSGGVWVADALQPSAYGLAGDARVDSIWDLASLTKPMAVTSFFMKAIAAGDVSLDDPVADGAFTVGALLGHRSGLPAWDDLIGWLDTACPGWTPGHAETRDHVRRRILSLPCTPTTAAYSDLGYILLGWHLEELTGRALDRLVPGFGVAPSDHARVMPTGWCPHRRRALLAEVHDPNTWALGGVAGHAGMFGTLHDVGRWALSLARADAQEPSVFDTETVRAFWSADVRGDGSTWVLGFDTPTPGTSLAGSRISPDSVGHYGFTGVSVWIDRPRGRVVVLLTNRSAHGDAAKPRIKRFRPWFHDRVFARLDGEELPPRHGGGEEIND